MSTRTRCVGRTWAREPDIARLMGNVAGVPRPPPCTACRFRMIGGLNLSGDFLEDYVTVKVATTVAAGPFPLTVAVIVYVPLLEGTVKVLGMRSSVLPIM